MYSAYRKPMIMRVKSSTDFEILVPAFLFFVSGFLHMLGCILLYKTKIQLVNQRIILINLSLVEMLLSFSVTANCMVLYYFKMAVVQWQYIELFMQTFLGFLLKCLMFHLLVDRMLDIHLHMRYPIVCTQKCVIKILACLWIFNLLAAITAVITRIFTNNYIQTMFVTVYFYTATDVSILLVTIACFIFLYMKVKSLVNCRTTCCRSRLKHKVGQYKKKFLLPCLIVTSYILFNLSGVIVLTIRTQMSRTNACSQRLLFAARILLSLGLLSDCVLYVFLQPQVRKLLKKLLTLPPFQDTSSIVSDTPIACIAGDVVL